MRHSPPRSYLLIGGLGYIGGHTALALHDAGHRVAVLDNLSTCGPRAWAHLRPHLPHTPLFVGDARDPQDVAKALAQSEADTVIHFAAWKSVPESVGTPLAYYRHNTDALLTVLETMDKREVRRLLFSSSAAVYGDTPSPIVEDTPLRPTSPYGATKAWGERILQDLAASDPRWSIAALRYFNPIGADRALRHGESLDQGTNVAAILARALLHNTPFGITGDDFPTPDGSGLRDYIHIADLAQAHIDAAHWLEGRAGYLVLNVGIGQPVSVKELASAFEQASGRFLNLTSQPRRPGDVAACWADCTTIQTRLGWRPQYDVAAMARDHWAWICAAQKGAHA